MQTFTERILDFNINKQVIRGAKLHEIQKIVQSHMLLQQARDDFLAFKLTEDEYLELLELHEINVDSYLKDISKNLEIAKIKI